MTEHEFRRALAALDMTQKQLADFLGWSIRAVHGYANGKPIPLPIQRLLRTMVNHNISPEDTDAHIRADE